MKPSSPSIILFTLLLALPAGTRPILAFDQGKCIESCDARYLSCAKDGDAARIKYCSDQHDQCRKGCLEHS